MAEEVIAGRYVILEELGRGASATVFRARDTTLQRPVALKVISSSLAADPEFAWRFEQEALLSAKLDHPHIVTVHDVGTLPDGRGFIAMRLLEGPSLDRLIAERGPLPPAEVAGLITQLAGALDYTHAAGLIHRDVKPSNVKVDASGWATLTDFGIARALDSARVTLPGLTIGTPRYMSPEQVRGENASPATDTYSLAVMAFEMLAGRAPFEGDGTALMYKIVHEPPPGLEEVSPGVSADVAEVIRRGLDKDPEARWASSGAFASALEQALRPKAVDASAAPTVVSRKPDADATMVAPATAATAVAPVEPATQVSPTATGTTVAAAAASSTVIPPATLASAPEIATDIAAPPLASPEPLDGSDGGGKKSRRGLLLALGGIAAVLALGAASAFALLGGGDGSKTDDDDDRNGSTSDRETPRPTRTPRPTSTPPTTSLGALAATATPTATNPAQPTPPPPTPTTAAIPPTAIPPTTAPAPAVPVLVDYVICHTSAACPYGGETLLAGYAMYVIFELSPVTNAFVEMEVFFDGAFEYTSPFTASSTGVYFDTIPYAEVPGFLSLDIYADGDYVGTMYGDVN